MKSCRKQSRTQTGVSLFHAYMCSVLPATAPDPKLVRKVRDIPDPFTNWLRIANGEMFANWHQIPNFFEVRLRDLSQQLLLRNVRTVCTLYNAYCNCTSGVSHYKSSISSLKPQYIKIIIVRTLVVRYSN
jgi:hypothetical protein